YAQWEDLLAQLAAHRAIVHRHFRQTVLAADERSSAEERLPHAAAWREAGQPEGQRRLEALGLDPDAAQPLNAALGALRTGPICARTDVTGRERLDRVMPLLLQ